MEMEDEKKEPVPRVCCFHLEYFTGNGCLLPRGYHDAHWNFEPLWFCDAVCAKSFLVYKQLYSDVELFEIYCAEVLSLRTPVPIRPPQTALQSARIDGTGFTVEEFLKTTFQLGSPEPSAPGALRPRTAPTVCLYHKSPCAPLALFLEAAELAPLSFCSHACARAYLVETGNAPGLTQLDTKGALTVRPPWQTLQHLRIDAQGYTTEQFLHLEIPVGGPTAPVLATAGPVSTPENFQQATAVTTYGQIVRVERRKLEPGYSVETF